MPLLLDPAPVLLLIQSGDTCTDRDRDHDKRDHGKQNGNTMGKKG